nr:sensor histidine kinase [Paenibacillus sonchi]
MNSALCVIPLLCLAVIYSYVSISNVREVSTNFINLFSTQLNSSIESYIMELDNITRTTFDDNNVTSFLNKEEYASLSEKITGKLAIDKFLYKMAILKPDVYQIMLVSNQNTVYSYSNTSHTVDGNILASQAWFQEIRNANGQLVVVPVHKQPYSSQGTNTDVFSVGRLIRDSTGSYGVIIFEIEPYQLLKFNSLQQTIKNNIYQAGITITTLNGDPIFSTEPDRSGEVGNSDYLTIRNEIPAAGMVTSVIIPKKVLYEKIHRFLLIALISGISILAVVFLFSYLFARKVSAPIKRLAQTMREAELGQYNVLPLTDRHDEIGLLNRSYNKMISTIKELIEDVYMSQLMHKQAQFSALQSQINPHMLFNTLESIRMTAAINGDKEVVQMVKRLGKMFRFNLAREGKANFISDEVDFIENYIALQNVRYKNRFVLQTDMDPKVMATPVIRFIFQPIIENSIIHGFTQKQQDWIIVIKGYMKGDDRIVLQFTDNGIGIDPDKLRMLNALLDAPPSIKPEASIGIGLQNIKDRIKLQYGNGYYLQIRSDEEFTTVEIMIPAQMKG